MGSHDARRPGRLRAIVAALLAPCLAGALAPQAPPPPEAASAAPQIEQTASVGDDARIAERIRGIFAAIDGLENVTVDVAAGVVTLAGSVGDPAARERAETIAGRVAGVVTVENAIERKVGVDAELTALGGLGDRLGQLREALPLFGIAAAAGLIVALLGYFLASLTGLWRRIASNAFLAELIASAIRFVFVVLALVVALEILGASALIGAVLGGAGVIGIALGFAMRDTIENYVASLLLSLRQPFRANDHVKIEEHEGRVIRLTSRATVLMTLDGNQLRIPNATVFKAVILNYTRNPERRFDFDLGIDADDDPVAASAVGVSALCRLDFVLPEPPPGAFVQEVGDSNIVIRFLGWIDQRQTDFLRARSSAIPEVKSALEGAGFAIPEPIYRLRIDRGGAPLPDEGARAGEEKTETETEPSPKQPALSPKRPAPAQAAPSMADTSPIKTIERLVDQERAGGGSAGDLLDSRRPVE